MAASTPDPRPRAADVRDNPAARRYELDLPEGAFARLDYRSEGGVLWLTHAEVPPVYEGHGVAAELVRGALQLARAAGARVVPVCGYVVAWMRRHPEFDDLRHSP